MLTKFFQDFPKCSTKGRRCSRGLPEVFPRSSPTLSSFFPGQCPPLCGLLANSFERVSLPAALRDLIRQDEEDLLALAHNFGQATQLAVELDVEEALVPVHSEHRMERSYEVLRVRLLMAEKEVVPGGSVHGERVNFTRLVLGCIEAMFCKSILFGIRIYLKQEIV